MFATMNDVDIFVLLAVQPFAAASLAAFNPWLAAVCILIGVNTLQTSMKLFY
jgi:hypothetical protein